MKEGGGGGEEGGKGEREEGRKEEGKVEGEHNNEGMSQSVSRLVIQTSFHFFVVRCSLHHSIRTLKNQ